LHPNVPDYSGPSVGLGRGMGARGRGAPKNFSKAFCRRVANRSFHPFTGQQSGWALPVSLRVRTGTGDPRVLLRQNWAFGNPFGDRSRTSERVFPNGDGAAEPSAMSTAGETGASAGREPRGKVRGQTRVTGREDLSSLLCLGPRARKGGFEEVVAARPHQNLSLWATIAYSLETRFSMVWWQGLVARGVGSAFTLGLEGLLTRYALSRRASLRAAAHGGRSQVHATLLLFQDQPASSVRARIRRRSIGKASAPLCAALWRIREDREPSP